MAFTVPEMPLTCDIYQGPWLTKVLRVSSPCNLAVGRRVQDGELPIGIVFGMSMPTMSLLLPSGTDIRDYSTNDLDYDIVECPQGSGRWYGVLGVDDVGKGFGNEHRLAYLSKIYEFLDPTPLAGCVWPTPIP